MSTIEASGTLTQAQVTGWPVTISAGVAVTLASNFTLTAADQYFIIGGTDAKLNGNYYTVTVQNVANYPGLVENGSTGGASEAENQGKNCTVEKIKLVSSGGSTLENAGGFIGQQYFSRGCTSTISECSSSGGNITKESGGISGKNSACLDGVLTIDKCFSTCTIGAALSEIDAGGIVGALAANVRGRVRVQYCFTTKTAIAIDTAGIFGRSCSKNSGTCELLNSFTIGGASQGKVIAADHAGILNVYNCFFTNILDDNKLTNGAIANQGDVEHRMNWNNDVATDTIGRYTFANPLNPVSGSYQPVEAGIWNTSVQPWTLLWIANEAGSGAAAAGAVGDPYIMTLSGELYKLDNKSGIFRMIQGNVDGKSLIINAEMAVDSLAEENDMNQWSLENDTVERPALTREAFFTRLFVKHGERECIADLKNGEVRATSAPALSVTGLAPKKCHATIYENEVSIGGAAISTGSVTVKTHLFENRQVRNSVEIVNASLIKECDGFAVRPMRTKQCAVKKINDSSMIKMKGASYKSKDQVKFTTGKTGKTVTIPRV